MPSGWTRGWTRSPLGITQRHNQRHRSQRVEPLLIGECLCIFTQRFLSVPICSYDYSDYLPTSANHLAYYWTRYLKYIYHICVYHIQHVLSNQVIGYTSYYTHCGWLLPSLMTIQPAPCITRATAQEMVSSFGTKTSSEQCLEAMPPCRSWMGSLTAWYEQPLTLGKYNGIHHVWFMVVQKE